MDDTPYMLTTKDNPWNPFTNYDEWNAWDQTHGGHLRPDGTMGLGYCTSAYLARIAVVSDEISPAQYTRAINDAIDEIVKYNITGNYVKVCEDDYKNWVPSDATTNGADPIVS